MAELRALVLEPAWEWELALGSGLALELVLAPEDPAVLMAAADWAQSKGDMDKARALLVKGRNQDPRNLAMVKALAGLEIERPARQQRHEDCLAGIPLPKCGRGLNLPPAGAWCICD